MPSHVVSFRLLLVPLVLLSFGCTSPGERSRVPDPGYGPVRITGKTAFSLLDPGCIEKNLDMVQRISGTYGKNHFALNAWVQADEKGITMELLNDLGSSLGELVFTGDRLTFTSSFLPKDVKAEYAVADFQLCFYRVPALRSALEALAVQTEYSADTEKRLIYEGDTLIIEIEKTPGFVRYTNHLRGYTYTLLGDF
jgi:hypothetical protein